MVPNAHAIQATRIKPHDTNTATSVQSVTLASVLETKIAANASRGAEKNISMVKDSYNIWGDSQRWRGHKFLGSAHNTSPDMRGTTKEKAVVKASSDA